MFWKGWKGNLQERPIKLRICTSKRGKIKKMNNFTIN